MNIKRYVATADLHYHLRAEHRYRALPKRVSFFDPMFPESLHFDLYEMKKDDMKVYDSEMDVFFGAYDGCEFDQSITAAEVASALNSGDFPPSGLGSMESHSLHQQIA